MSRLYDTVEPSVIDDDILNTAVEEQGPKDEAGRLAKQEGIEFKEVLSLRLDFKNILNIDNLWCFDKLTKLQLDNNIIEKIKGLDHLVNLIWLDLSFNNIEIIEGLDTLTKLTDLSLYNNRIEVIENLDKNEKLHVLSLGNNRIENLEDSAIYLRRFQQLRTLNLSGNPIADNDEYKIFITAYVSQLSYLDYRLLDDQMKEIAQNKFQRVLEEMTNDEAADMRRKDVQKQEEEEERIHYAAFVEKMNTDDLFNTLYGDDTEGIKINKMPGVDELLTEYREKFVEVCTQIFELGLDAHSKRQTEVDEFWAAVNEFKNENKVACEGVIEEFITYKTRLFEELQIETDTNAMQMRVNEYNARVHELWDSLMGLELSLLDQLEEMISNFERSVSDLSGAFIESCQALTAQLRDHENIHHEKMLEMGVLTLEKALKNELEVEIPDALRDLLVDKDTIVNAITSSHDHHLLKIDNREDEMVTKTKNWEKNLIDWLHEEEEVNRNRSRVIEITNLIDHLREEIDFVDVGNPMN